VPFRAGPDEAGPGGGGHEHVALHAAVEDHHVVAPVAVDVADPRYLIAAYRELLRSAQLNVQVLQASGPFSGGFGRRHGRVERPIPQWLSPPNVVHDVWSGHRSAGAVEDSGLTITIRLSRYRCDRSIGDTPQW
jgi:hypothetical protein